MTSLVQENRACINFQPSRQAMPAEHGKLRQDFNPRSTHTLLRSTHRRALQSLRPMEEHFALPHSRTIAARRQQQLHPIKVHQTHQGCLQQGLGRGDALPPHFCGWWLSLAVRATAQPWIPAAAAAPTGGLGLCLWLLNLPSCSVWLSASGAVGACRMCRWSLSRCSSCLITWGLPPCAWKLVSTRSRSGRFPELACCVTGAIFAAAASGVCRYSKGLEETRSVYKNIPPACRCCCQTNAYCCCCRGCWEFPCALHHASSQNSPSR